MSDPDDYRDLTLTARLEPPRMTVQEAICILVAGIIVGGMAAVITIAARA